MTEQLDHFLNIISKGFFGSAETIGESTGLNKVGGAVKGVWNSVTDGLFGKAHAAEPAYISGHALEQAQSNTGLDWSNPAHREAILDGLKMVESSGNDRARAGGDSTALGGYQINNQTAKHLGLRIGGFNDERLDPAKSRKAAERYLDELYKRHGSIEDAIQAYHDGSGNVNLRKRGGHNKVIDSKESLQYTSKVLHQANLARALKGGYTASRDSGSTTSTHINTVVVNSNPQSADKLAESVQQRANRSVTNAAFSGSMR